MVRAIREYVTVDQDGSIRLTDPALRVGARAEIIVLLDTAQGSPPASMTPLQALDALQAAARLDPDTARQWIEQAAAERKASSRL
jgi:hypothetical protein